MFIASTANAQSTIYFFFSKAVTTNASIHIQFNRQEVFLLKEKQKKVCNMRSEGKLNISLEKSFNVGTFNQHISWADEIQLNLTKNSVHYIRLKNTKGGRALVFEELTEAQGKRELAIRSYKDTFAYDEP